MELEFLRWLRERIPSSPQVALGIGDDAALLNQTAGKQTVVTTDMLMDGVDFRLAECGARAAGRKALAVNLSDLAAMGARPVAAFVSLALPRSDEGDLAKQLLEGLLPLATEYECAIAGGDTNTWDGPLAISITAIGEANTGRSWLRSGAQPGDAILATGAFGGSIRGRHLTFTPRVRDALLLQELGANVHAAIDVSDGLSLDLSRICDASSCGALINLMKVPIHSDATALANPLDRALGDGEDFELILAVPALTAEQLLATQPLGIPLTQIGWFEAELGMRQQLASGEIEPLSPRGYEH
jgi:thiamine-monophosphate kinase